MARESVDVLTLLDPDEHEALGAAIGGIPMRSVAMPEDFLHPLEIERPRVVVIGAPPATSAIVEAVAAERRRRPGLRCVLVNAPSGVEERLRALELGYDAALPAGTPMAELAGRVVILARAGAARGPARTRIAIGDGVELARLPAARRPARSPATKGVPPARDARPSPRARLHASGAA